MSGPAMDARQTILARIEGALSRSDPLFRGAGTDVPATPGVPTAVTTAEGDKRARASQFGANLEAVSGSCEIVERSADVARSIVTKIGQWSGRVEPIVRAQSTDILSWDPAHLPVPGLDQQLKTMGVSLNLPSDLHQDGCRATSAAIDVGLTGVDAAFAGTGTLALASGPGKSRAASLLPRLHLAIVPMSRIHPTLEAWVQTLRAEGDLTEFWTRCRQIAFVTGPSKSADIELNLTLGVHGPREVHAIVFDDDR